MSILGGRIVTLAVAFIGLFALASAAKTTQNGWDEPPDLILQPPPFVVHAGVPNEMQRFQIPIAQVKDRWIRALQFQSCKPKSIESAYFTVDKTGQWLGAWIPGERMNAFPDTVAAYLPMSSKIVMEIHYAAVSEDTTDCSMLGLFLTDRKPLRPLIGMGVATPLRVPPNGAVDVRKEFTIISDSYALALRPEMLGTGSAIEIDAVEPSGSTHTLLALNEMDAEQSPSVFEQPVFMPKGTRVIAKASYVNPDSNDTAEDFFKMTMTLYPSAEYHPSAYDAPMPVRGRRSAAARQPVVKTLKKKTTSRKKK